MSNQKANSVDRFARRDSAGRGFRAGVAKDQLIFIIICSAALLVAAVTMVRFFTGSSKKGATAISWQCLSCGDEFSKKTSERPPIECPKCGGEAVQVSYRKCPSCGAKVMCNRLRLSERGQAQRDAMKKQAEATGRPVAAVSGPMMMMPMDMEIQYRLKQADGSFAWTDWMPAAGSSQRAVQLQNYMRCTECDALLFPPSPRSGGSGN